MNDVNQTKSPMGGGKQTPAKTAPQRDITEIADKNAMETWGIVLLSFSLVAVFVGFIEGIIISVIGAGFAMFSLLILAVSAVVKRLNVIIKLLKK